MADGPGVILEADGKVNPAEANFAAPAQANINLAAGRVAAEKKACWQSGLRLLVGKPGRVQTKHANVRDDGVCSDG